MADYSAMKEKLRREGLAEQKAKFNSTAGSPAQTSMRYGSMTNEQEQIAERPWFQVGEYDTKLSPEKESEFRAWAVKRGIDRDLEDYDLRGAWAANEVPDAGHGTDRYKKPNHPTFSVESIYAKDRGAGRWEDGRFVAGPANLKYRDIGALVDYFDKYEPGVKLDWSELVPK